MITVKIPTCGAPEYHNESDGSSATSIASNASRTAAATATHAIIGTRHMRHRRSSAATSGQPPHNAAVRMAATAGPASPIRCVGQPWPAWTTSPRTAIGTHHAHDSAYARTANVTSCRFGDQGRRSPLMTRANRSRRIGDRAFSTLDDRRWQRNGDFVGPVLNRVGSPRGPYLQQHRADTDSGRQCRWCAPGADGKLCRTSTRGFTMWAQLIRSRLKEGGDVGLQRLEEQLRDAEQPGSGLVRTLIMRDQQDPNSLLMLVVFESEAKARAVRMIPAARRHSPRPGRRWQRSSTADHRSLICSSSTNTCLE